MIVENSSIRGWVYNNFDWVFRFAYCKIPFVSGAARSLFFPVLYSSDFSIPEQVFEEVRGFISGGIHGKTVLEIGPGNSSALALNFLANGAAKYIMVDKFPRVFDTEFQKDFFRKESAFYLEKYGRKVAKFIKGGGLDGRHTKFINEGVENMPSVPDGSVDIVVSVSAFEHVKEVKESLSEVSRVLAPGGVLVSQINMQDHYNFNSPFRFLKYSDFAWRCLLTKEGHSYTNRLRIDDFLGLMAEAGLGATVLSSDNWEGALDKRAFAPRFREKKESDLRIMSATIIAKKGRAK
ncbi:MAG: methyltransferase domain-containing protein [Candidatus Diapherotrites archaeon]|nr:methyltransferase domain-containing protein [Candidatus Diapherotrites archaeon]